MTDTRMSDERFIETRRRLSKERYATLKSARPDLYERAAQTASALAHNHDLSLTIAAAIEGALVDMAMEAI